MNNILLNACICIAILLGFTLRDINDDLRKLNRVNEDIINQISSLKYEVIRMSGKKNNYISKDGMLTPKQLNSLRNIKLDTTKDKRKNGEINQWFYNLLADPELKSYIAKGSQRGLQGKAILDYLKKGNYDDGWFGLGVFGNDAGMPEDTATQDMYKAIVASTIIPKLNLRNLRGKDITKAITPQLGVSIDHKNLASLLTNMLAVPYLGTDEYGISRFKSYGKNAFALLNSLGSDKNNLSKLSGDMYAKFGVDLTSGGDKDAEALMDLMQYYIATGGKTDAQSFFDFLSKATPETLQDAHNMFSYSGDYDPDAEVMPLYSEEGDTPNVESNNATSVPTTTTEDSTNTSAQEEAQNASVDPLSYSLQGSGVPPVYEPRYTSKPQLTAEEMYDFGQALAEAMTKGWH